MWSTNDYSLVERCAGLRLPLHPQRQFDHLLVVGYLGHPPRPRSRHLRWVFLWTDGLYALAAGFTGLAKRRDGPMSKKGITGHDEWVVTEALATALIALEHLPPNHQPQPHMDDIRKLLSAGCQPGMVQLHLAQAKCRLFPDLDPLTIYREYGLGDGQG